MICIDEFGPLEIRPVGGTNWAPKAKPLRVPATYNRFHGVRYLFGAYDLTDDRLFGHMKRRKRRVEFFAFLRAVRSRYPPEERIYVVLDNLSTHRHHSIREWADNSNVELVFTPTNASWLNRIECHFGALRKFVLSNSNYESHEELARATQAYLRWRNANKKNRRLLKAQQRCDIS